MTTQSRGYLSRNPLDNPRNEEVEREVEEEWEVVDAGGVKKEQ